MFSKTRDRNIHILMDCRENLDIQDSLENQTQVKEWKNFKMGQLRLQKAKETDILRNPA